MKRDTVASAFLRCPRDVQSHNKVKISEQSIKLMLHEPDMGEHTVGRLN